MSPTTELNLKRVSTVSGQVFLLYGMACLRESRRGESPGGHSPETDWNRLMVGFNHQVYVQKG